MLKNKYQPGQPIDWHKGVWDGVPNPIAFAMHRAFFEEKEIFGFGRNFYIVIFKKKRFYLGYDNDDLLKTGKNIVNKWENNKARYKKTKKEILEAGKELEKTARIVENFKIRNLSDKELWQIYEKLFKNYTDTVKYQAVAEPITSYLQPTIYNHLKNFDPKTKLIITILTWPSFLQKKQIGEIKIIKKILKDKSLKKIFRKRKPALIKKTIREKYPYLWKDFTALAKKFFWIKNNYIKSQLLKEEFFIKEIKNLLTEINYKQKNLPNPKINLDKETKIKTALIKKLKLSKKLRFLIEVLDFIAFVQDLRKALFIKHIYHFDLLLREISRRAELAMIEIKYLSPEEIKKAFLEKKNFKYTISKRRKSFITCKIKEKTIMTPEPEVVKKYFNWLTKPSARVSILEGTSACLGPKFKGRIKTCITAKESYKLKKGEILVTTNTTPDYVTAMKKAKAILTEKGGLTSHAAIVSRELKIPCIVGINNVTDLLKDGDLVEVDTNKGMVKIIKKTK